MNPHLANILGDTDSDFENIYFLGFLWIPNFQISRLGLGRAWAGPGPGCGQRFLVPQGGGIPPLPPTENHRFFVPRGGYTPPPVRQEISVRSLAQARPRPRPRRRLLVFCPRGGGVWPLIIFTLRGEKKFRGADALGDSLTSGRAPTAPQGHSPGRGWGLAGAWTRPFHRHA